MAQPSEYTEARIVQEESLRREIQSLGKELTAEPLALLDKACEKVTRKDSSVILSSLTKPTLHLNKLASYWLDTMKGLVGVDRLNAERRELAATFSESLYDHVEIDPKKQTIDEMFDTLSRIDPKIREFLSNPATRRKLESVFTLPSKRSIVYEKRSQALKKEHSDERVPTDFGCFDIIPAIDQQKYFLEMINRRPNDVAHTTTCMVMYELLSRATIARNHFLSHVYEARTTDSQIRGDEELNSSEALNKKLLTVSEIEEIEENKRKGRKKDEYRQWRQAGAVRIPFHTFRVNVSSQNNVNELTLELSDIQARLEGFYSGDANATNLLYLNLYSQIQLKLKEGTPPKTITKETIRRAYETKKPQIIRDILSRVHLPHKKTIRDEEFSAADMQVHFARSGDHSKASRIAELNNITGDTQEATPHLFTLYASQSGAIDKMKIRTSHRANNGIVTENLLHQNVGMLSLLPKAVTENSIQPGGDKVTSITEMNSVSTKQRERLNELERAIPTGTVTTFFSEQFEKSIKDRVGQLNTALKDDVTKDVGCVNKHEYLMNTDWLITFATGVFSTIYNDIPCKRMDYLFETPEGDIMPGMLPLPYSDDFISAYKEALRGNSEDITVSASKKRGERIAYAFGVLCRDKELSTNPLLGASAAARLSIAAGSRKDVLRSLADTVDPARNELLDKGNGGLVSRLGAGGRELQLFEGAMTTHHTGQPSVTIYKADSAASSLRGREITLKIDAEKKRVVDEFSGIHLLKIITLMLKDLEAYKQSKEGFASIVQARQ